MINRLIDCFKMLFLGRLPDAPKYEEIYMKKGDYLLQEEDGSFSLVRVKCEKEEK